MKRKHADRSSAPRHAAINGDPFIVCWFAIFADAAECVSADAYNFRSLSDYVVFVCVCVLFIFIRQEMEM